MSGFQRYGLFGSTVNGESGENDAKLYKKYSTKINWGERIFYRRHPLATKVFELESFPQKLVEHTAVNGIVQTEDRHRYIDLYDGFLIWENRAYQFKRFVQNSQFPNGTWVDDDTLNEVDTSFNMESPNVFPIQASTIWYWRGDKYVYTCDFDCINTTPITTTTDEMIAGGLAKMQTVALKTQAFNDLPDEYEPNRFDIIAWNGDLYIVDEQDSIPHYRPALVKDCIVSLTKLL